MHIKNKKGIILITAYMVIAVLGIIGGAFISRSISEIRIAEREKNSIQAFYLAEAGIDYILDRLRKTGTTSGEKTSTLSNIGSYSCEWSLSNNVISAESTGTVNDVSRIIQVDILPDTFARYLYFTNTEHFRWMGWYLPVWFSTEDSVEGPLQTNGHLHIAGNPAFSDPNYHKPVKSEDNFITYMNGGSPRDKTTLSNPPYDYPTFQDGAQLGVEQVPLPSKALDLRTAAVHDGLMLTGPTTIVLKNNGTMDVTNSNKKWVNYNIPLPENGAVFVDGGNVTVYGTLNGQLSIGTNRDIIITNNVLYNTNPRTNPESTDVLALIAERNVVISESAPYNLEIDASIMALGDSFVLENWWNAPIKGTLTVLGGIIQKERGPIGTFDPYTNQKTSGYSKNYIYDARLLQNPPPFYPTTGDYTISNWREKYE